MKNLTSTFSHKWVLPGLVPGAESTPSTSISAIAFNLDDDTFWACRETIEGEEVIVEVLHGENDKTGELVPFVTLPACPIAPFQTPSDFKQVLSIMHLPEEESLCVILAGGDIVLIKLGEVEEGEESPEPEIVGSILPGIKSLSWSPTLDLLILINGSDTLLVMTPTFEVIHEGPLRSEDQGEEVQINVGWGSKSTQFHGSLGKAAAEGSGEEVKGPIGPMAKEGDDGLPRISWRGDGLYFSISSLDAYAQSTTSRPRQRRQIRVYSRNPIALSTTSEPVLGLDSPISWRPSGNLIAAVQSFGPSGSGLETGEGWERGRCDVVMFERNGLRHGEFRLREDRRDVYTSVDLRKGQRMPKWRVKSLSYNSESTVLAVWIEREDADVVQLWTMNNYHYYLKAEWRVDVSVPGSNEVGKGAMRFDGIVWHPERGDEVWLFARGILQRRRFMWETVAANIDMPSDTGTVAVIDGHQILLTPFRTQNVPPPMSSYSITLPCTPVHVCFPPNRDQLAVLLPDGRYMLWELNTRIPKKGSRGGGVVANPVMVVESKAQCGDTIECKQISVTATGEVAILSTDGIAWYEAGQKEEPGETGGVYLPSEGRIIPGAGRTHYTMREDGTISHETPLAEKPTSAEGNALSSFCFDIKSSTRWPGLLFGRTPQSKLYVTKADLSGKPLLLSSECTSLALTQDFAIWTTSSHDSKYAPIAEIDAMMSDSNANAMSRNWEARRIERGSQIVTVVPSSMALVLQMPRGNLETINPRPLVLEVVKRDIINADYRSAFVNCRKHRIDLNILYDLEPEAFLRNIEVLVEQVSEVDYLNLLVSGLKNENIAKSLYQQSTQDKPELYTDKVNTVCDAIRKYLTGKDLVKYVDTVLTAHVCKTPPDLESGLDVLRGLRATNPDAVEEAVKYIIFLTNVNRLYDVALGMYDFQLVLLVAQYSQRDPKEYLPFLRELRALPKHYQRFRIDDHLERHDSALRNLRLAGDERFEQAATYTQTHGLYSTALEIYADDREKLAVVQDLYGDHLMETREFMEAARVFQSAGQTEKALDALERAHAWKELLTLAQDSQISAEELSDRCDRVADYLGSHGRQLEAAQVYLQYRDDVDQAVHVLCRGAKFTEAQELIISRSRPDLIASEVHPGLDDANEQAIDTFDEMEGQLDKEVSRLAELDAKLEEDADAFFMIESEPMMENVDVMTEATTAATGFTRFTAARSTATGTSKNTAKSRRLGRKKAKGRKGTVDEFEYLLASLARLVERVEDKTAECDPLLYHLRATSEDYNDVAIELEEKVLEFRTKLSRSLDQAWTQKAKVDEARKVAFGEDEALAALVAQHMQMEGVTPAVAEVDPDRPVVGEKPVLKEWPRK